MKFLESVRRINTKRAMMVFLIVLDTTAFLASAYFYSSRLAFAILGGSIFLNILWLIQILLMDIREGGGGGSDSEAECTGMHLAEEE